MPLLLLLSTSVFGVSNYSTYTAASIIEKKEGEFLAAAPCHQVGKQGRFLCAVSLTIVSWDICPTKHVASFNARELQRRTLIWGPFRETEPNWDWPTLTCPSFRCHSIAGMSCAGPLAVLALLALEDLQSTTVTYIRTTALLHPTLHFGTVPPGREPVGLM